MKYAYLQWKKLMRALPFTLIVAILLSAIATVVFSTAADFVSNEQMARFKLDVVGESDSRFFKTGLAALSALDSSNISIDLELTDEETAKNDLLLGNVSAYVVIPDGFMEATGRGEILPIAYYTTASTLDVSALMRDEFTAAISTVLKYSQKAVFGEERMLYDSGYRSIAYREINELDLEFINFIMDRDHLYQTEITGVSHGVNGIQNLFLGMFVILLCICMIPIGCQHMRRGNSMLKMMAASGKGAVYTTLAEYGAVLTVLLLTMALLVFGGMALSSVLDFSSLMQIGLDVQTAALSVFPIAVMLCAFAFLFFEAAGNLISAVTGYFFCFFGLCYVSGCMYPLYALPDTLQAIAGYTPMGVAREYLVLAVTGGKNTTALLYFALYTVLFVGLSVLVRRRQLSKGEG